jgi:hypothetical protein
MLPIALKAADSGKRKILKWGGGSYRSIGPFRVKGGA